jgi:hypothetical protein
MALRREGLPNVSLRCSGARSLLQTCGLRFSITAIHCNYAGGALGELCSALGIDDCFAVKLTLIALGFSLLCDPFRS